MKYRSVSIHIAALLLLTFNISSQAITRHLTVGKLLEESDSTFVTISASLASLDLETTWGCTVEVNIQPGVYRESISWEANPELNITLILGAIDPGSVVISGSDVWTDWSQVSEGIYEHRWDYNWGLQELPNWRARVKNKIKPITRRREMIFLNGRRLTQDLASQSLEFGEYYVDDEKKILRFRSRDFNPLEDTVEVAVRPDLFEIRNSANVILRGLAFRHSSQGIQNSAVSILKCTNIEIDRCTFEQNNWGGLRVIHCNDITLSNCTAIENGGHGVVFSRSKKITIDNCTTSGNNWRGFAGGYTSWSVAGLKMLRCKNVEISNHVSRDNLAHGFWFDYDNVDVRFENAILENNLEYGLFVEANTGPVLIKDCMIRNNRKEGVRIANSDSVTITGCEIRDNSVQLSIHAPERIITRWESKEKLPLNVRELRIVKNTIASSRSGERLLVIHSWLIETEDFRTSFTSDFNTWESADPENAFRTVGIIGYKSIGIDEWRKLSDQDSNSTMKTIK